MDSINTKYNKFIEVKNIMESNLNDYEKIIKVIDVYNSSKSFISAYSRIIKYGCEDKRFYKVKDDIINIGNKLVKLEEDGVYSNVKYFLKNAAKFYLYDYSKFVIEKYINEESYLTKVFLSTLGISEEVFNSALNVIEELDVDLYKRYLLKKKENIVKRYNANMYAFKSIDNGIKTGYTLDNEKFDILTFWKLVPFKYSDGVEREINEFKILNDNITFSPASDFYNRINKFLNSIDKNLAISICTYMRKNKIDKYTYLSIEDLKEMYNTTKIIVNNEEIDKTKEFEIVVKYLRVNNLPLLAQTIKIVQQMYRKNEIDIDLLEDYKDKEDYYLVYSKK